MMFETGKRYPPNGSIERLTKYRRMSAIFKGNRQEIYQRASTIMKDAKQGEQLQKLYIAVNIADIFCTKPADMLTGEPPKYHIGYDESTIENAYLRKYVEDNKLNQMLHESATTNGYKGDAFLRVRYDYLNDYSEYEKYGLEIPSDAEMTPIIESIDAENVFPELSTGSNKKFKAVNITRVDTEPSIDEEGNPVERYELFVERHIPNYIITRRFHLASPTAMNQEGLVQFTIGDEIGTPMIQETGVDEILVYHIPYKSVDDDWRGIGTLEKTEHLLYAINDRLTQIDYILWKHADPNAYGPPLERNDSTTLDLGGRYFEITTEDVTPNYMTWNAQLDAAFKELDMLIAMAFTLQETPQWLFGTVLAGDQKGGTGTSHTDSATTKLRFMPIITKVNRIREKYDSALKSALKACYALDKVHGDYDKNVIKPNIQWFDGLPRNEKEIADILQMRLGGKTTIDQLTAIKELSNVDEDTAQHILDAIKADDESEKPTVSDLDYFNNVETTEGDEDE